MTKLNDIIVKVINLIVALATKAPVRQDDYNVAFAEWYQQTQDAFFDCFPNVSRDDYTDYAAVKDNTLLNAGMQWLASDKQAFLADKYEALDNNFKYVGK